MRYESSRRDVRDKQKGLDGLGKTTEKGEASEERRDRRNGSEDDAISERSMEKRSEKKKEERRLPRAL